MSRARPESITLVPQTLVRGLGLSLKWGRWRVFVEMEVVGHLGVDPHGGPVVLEWVRLRPEGPSVWVGMERVVTGSSIGEWKARWVCEPMVCGWWKRPMCDRWRRVLPEHWVVEGGWVRVRWQRYAWERRAGGGKEGERVKKGRGMG